MSNNIVNILYENAELYPDKVALIHGKKQLTYKELAQKIQQIAACFTAKGIAKDDKILLFVPMSLDLYAILLALWHCGATAVFLDAWVRKNRLEQAAALVKCKAFIGIPKAHILRLFSKEVRKIPVNIFAGLIRYKTKQKAPAVAEVAKADTALITFTTGSTDVPKAANRTHGFLIAQHEVLTKHLQPKATDINLATLPIVVLTNLAAGITTIIPDFNPAKPEAINPMHLAKVINRYKLTTTAGSPIIYAKLADYCLKEKVGLQSLKKISLGGAPVFLPLAKKLIKAFPETAVEIIYGSTEAEPISTITAKDLVASNSSIQTEGLLVGKPIAEIKVRIIPVTGNIGEICVAGDHVLKDYYRNDTAWRQNKIVDGDTIWHRTGDAGYLDQNGFLYLMGRLKQRFTHNDKIHYLFPLEAKLLEYPEIVIGTYLKKDNKLLLFIESATIVEQEIQQYCTANNMPVADQIIFGKIARDPRHNSKIDYGALNASVKN
ncbi:MAG: AMP-binding protein [Gammaproteobacteria bacterium]|nr:AMP-binding protein [Gammaproteobacteria bacterium]